jgi:hypothetical protein
MVKPLTSNLFTLPHLKQFSSPQGLSQRPVRYQRYNNRILQGPLSGDPAETENRLTHSLA